ncbi:MAG: hypothetical protein ACR652_16775 [Methylocystis sp.]|uniref:hypothetical protein n=1 Tax=Methylocystis sp. TaxID=1911079 RepID=UPI003DA237D9
MRAPQLPKIDLSDAGLKLTGVALAGGSVALAAHMMSRSGDPPRITGLEHLAIYARPSNHMRGAPSSSAPSAPRQGIDDMPVGSIGKSSTSAVLAGYEILDAAPEWALLRLPGGRIARVPRGGRIVGLGAVLDIERRSGKWTLVTQNGVIRAP